MRGGLPVDATRVFAAWALVVGLVAVPRSADAQHYLVHTYTGVRDLPNRAVFGVAQDRVGRMWFATRSGLAVFDGATWTSYGSPDQLPSRTWTHVRCDRSGGVWAVSMEGNVVSFDGRSWSTLPTLPLEGFSSAPATAFAVAEDAAGPVVGVAFGESGLALWRSGSWQSIAIGPPGTAIRGLAAWNGGFYVAIDEGLARIDANGAVHELTSIVPPHHRALAAIAVTAAAGTHEPEIWVLSDVGLGRITDGTFTHVCDVAFGMSQPDGATLAVDPAEGVFFGVFRALFHYDVKTGELHRLDKGSGLASDGANDLVVDREHNLWVASARGVSKLVSQQFATLRRVHGLLDDEVTAVCEPRPGRLVFGHNTGLTVVEGSSFRRLQFSVADRSSAEIYRVMDLSADSDGNVWIAAHDLGLGVLRESGTLRWYGGLEGIYLPVTAVACDRDDSVWVASPRQLVHRAGGRARVVLRLPQSDGYIRRLVPTPDRGVLVAASTGLFEVTESGASRIATPDSDIFSVTVDRGGRLWAGSRSGPLVGEGGILAVPDQRALQGFGPVYVVVEDRDGNLWFGGNDGVRRWDGHSVSHFTPENGFAGLETNRGGALVDSGGSLWIGTDNGISVHRPRYEKAPAPAPVVLLEAVEVAGKRQAADGPLTLAHNDNSLVFRFVAISFRDERAVRYQVRLDGFDAGWSEELSQRYARYTNLRPGDYRFSVRAVNVDGVWSADVQSARIRISKPYWKRWWFYLVSLVALVVALRTGIMAATRWRYAGTLEREVEQRKRELGERKRAQAELQRTALHDSLTDLPNRTLFLDRLRAAVAQAGRREDFAFAVLFLDLDRFKVVNDSLGHAFGDQLLVACGQRLQQILRSGDTIARLGGDEFTILLNDIESELDPVRVARRIKRELSLPFAFGTREVYTSASIGIALSTTGYDRPDAILRDADIAMYRAKAQGSARYAIFDPSMHAHAVYRLQLETDLRRAEQRGEFVLHFQPIVSLASGELAAMEALVRWLHPERGLLEPVEFLSVAEETGMILPMGEWVLREACRQAAVWGGVGRKDLPAIHVNLFSRQFSRPQLVTVLEEILAETGLPAHRLHLEITEGALMEATQYESQVLSALADLDVRLYLDDFGTGYSSLGYLQRLAVQGLKIDRSFVAGIDGGGTGTQVVEAIVALAHTLDLEVHVEGVETVEQAHILRELGCGYAQGFLFSRPVDSLSARRLVDERAVWESATGREVG